jgi:hypothetical protein
MPCIYMSHELVRTHSKAVVAYFEVLLRNLFWIKLNKPMTITTQFNQFLDRDFKQISSKKGHQYYTFRSNVRCLDFTTVTLSGIIF